MVNQAPDVTNLVASLLRDGFLVLPHAMSPELHQTVSSELAPHFEQASFCTGAFYGAETKRFGRAFIRSPAAEHLALDPTILGILDKVLGPNCDALQLNLTQGIEIFPGAPAQGPHRDHDMWGGLKDTMERMVNVMWALDDFTERNGATRIWPGSNHRLEDGILPEYESIAAEMPAGSACLFLGSTLHAGGANRSHAPRRGLVISYCLGWLKPSENQWLAYPPDVARKFSRELAELVGYKQQAPNLGHFEGQCPSILLRGGSDTNGFSDALRPEQVILAEHYRAVQSDLAAAA